MANEGAILARGVSDADDRLISAEETLADLQLRCGGELPGTIAIPALLEAVRSARRHRLKLARPVSLQDGDELISAWVEIAPRRDGEEGCEIALRDLRTSALPPEFAGLTEQRRLAIDRQLAELSARLDSRQNLLFVECDAPDLGDLYDAMRKGQGERWTRFVALGAQDHREPLHWRLLDGSRLRITGSERDWRVTLVPHGRPGTEPEGFELLLIADQPPPDPHEDTAGADQERDAPLRRGLVGEDIAPALRQPIARIIANAETIRARLAGPLPEDYANYAAEIAVAGQHLLGLLDDLADLEVVESENFSTAPDRIDLAEVARKAAGILNVRARERDIGIDAPQVGESLPAVAEFRRVLQILLNLIGNAIRYSPEGSRIWIRVEEADGRARLVVADQGAGLSEDQQRVVFDKFERLGRSGDGGSGLGLYISRRLARAMHGDLSVESAPGQGARFILDLPGDDSEAPGD